jgi:putative tricarboxylic transport membrane protein
MQSMFEALIEVLHLYPLLAMVGGVIIGIVLSALPGLSATLGIALAIPFTYVMSPLSALGLLAGIHNGASQGGAIPAILLKIPGTPGTICTAWDGYPLAQQGHAGGAINLAAVSSAVGGALSALSLILLAPPLAQVALAFGPPEIFWVNIFGLAAVSSMLGEDLLKGVLSTCFGLLLASIGTDNVTGQERFVFDSLDLFDGLPQLAVMVGLFSLPPAWELAERAYQVGANQLLQIKSEKRIWKLGQVWAVWLKSSIIGIIIGILPGSAVSTFVAYSEAKRSSREPEKFGKGSIEGLAAAESVNNADNAAAMIPTLTLGVPGSNIAALMLGALLIQGFQPGPQLFRDAPEIVYGYAWAMFVTSLLLIPLGGAAASKLFAHVLRVPMLLLLPLIVVTAITGAFASENSMFQVYIVGLFGVVGWFMQRYDFPVAPAVIGLVLGHQVEFNLRVSLLMSYGNWSIFYTRPICIALIALTLLVLFYPAIGYFRKIWSPGASR